MIQPEHHLMLAVLEDALAIIVRGPAVAASLKLFAETRDWAASDDISWPFSFLNVCENLDVDATRLRTRLAPWVGLPSWARPWRPQRPALERAGATRR